MQNVGTSLKTRLMIVAILLMAFSAVGGVTFTASSPGGDLSPVDDAAGVIQILQGQRTILWTSLQGPVGTIVTRGWPVIDEGTELGGALVIERPEDAYAGVIAFGEKPMSVVFETG